MKRTLLTAAGVLALAAFPAAAQTPSGIAVYGTGSVTCQTWLAEAKDGPDHQRHTQWLLGYISGYNIFAAYNEDLHPGGADAVTGSLDNRYCPLHPTDTIAVAGMRLIDEMRARTGWSTLRKSHPVIQYSN